MRVVAAVHALWLCGTEKCPFDFATDGDSADSDSDLRIRRGWIYFCPSRPLTRSISVVNLPELSALRPIGSSARLSHSQSKMRSTLSVR
jgi:hypothetical protein